MSDGPATRNPREDKVLEKVLADIDRVGCSVLHIFPTAEDGDCAPFAYSAGIWKTCGAPELIVVGLKQPLAHSVVNGYHRRVQAGERFRDEDIAGDFVGGFDVLFRDMEKAHYPEYIGVDRWLYRGDDFPVLQLVYPSTAGIWPWQAEASEFFRGWQTLLCAPPLHDA